MKIFYLFIYSTLFLLTIFFMNLGCKDYEIVQPNITTNNYDYCYDCGWFTDWKLTFINKTSNNLLLLYKNYNFFILKTNQNTFISDSEETYFSFYNIQTNFIFRITNYLTNIATVVTITNKTSTIKIDDSTFTNAYWGTTNEE